MTLDSEAMLNIDRIQKAALRMQALIKDILTFSKLSVEKDQFVKTDLKLVVREVLDETAGYSRRKERRYSYGALA
jgi:light-regulated signal transduction histidine kinase (bacteriophytochrome)